MKGALAAVALAGMIAGCNQGVQSTNEPPLKWETFTDGSKIARRETGDDSGAVMRCWTVDNQQDCLMGFDGQFREVRRTLTASLPARSLTLEETQKPINGYACDTGDVGNGYQEHIGNNHGQLNQHVAASTFRSEMEKSWTRAYVDDYMKANAISPTYRYFNCFRLWDKLEGNSLAALASSSVTRESLD